MDGSRDAGLYRDVCPPPVTSSLGMGHLIWYISMGQYSYQPPTPHNTSYLSQVVYQYSNVLITLTSSSSLHHIRRPT